MAKYAGPLLLWIGVVIAASLFPTNHKTIPAGYSCQQQTATVSVCRSHNGPDLLIVGNTIRPYSLQALKEATQ